MSKTCVWCDASLQATSETAIQASHALCPGCLGELQSALLSNGLREAESLSSAASR